MNVIFSARAEADLREILADIAARYPTALAGFEARLKHIILQIGRWPEATQKLESRPGVRMVPPIRYPYHLFDKVDGGMIEIVHIRHGARASPEGE